jgi:hypothetical protein
MLTYKTVNDWRRSLGSSLQGYLPKPTTFEELAGMLGEPLPAGDKTLAEWVVRFGDGTVATVYDYKNRGMRREALVSWHVGGFGPRAAELMAEALED